MPTLCSHKECTGCATCFAVCPQHAISMEKDIYGFLYPKIDHNKCIECNLCEKKCPLLHKQEYKIPEKIIACYWKDEKKRIESTSGGIGTLLAQEFTKNNGIIYGCAFTPPFNICHIRCTTIENILRLRGSKYVQSEIHETYTKINEDLKTQKNVLFIGTPCQIAGIKARFPKHPNLFTVELICHGVPSCKFLKESIPSNILKKRIKQINFRSNSQYKFSLIEDNQILPSYQRPLSNDLYMKAFFNGITYRPSCLSCHFARKERNADMTIGDFWGLKSTKITDINKGVSLVLINTNAGKTLFNLCSDSLYSEERPYKEALDANEPLNHPIKKSIRYNVFRTLYPHFGYKYSLFFALPDKILAMKIKYYLKHNK